MTAVLEHGHDHDQRPRRTDTTPHPPTGSAGSGAEAMSRPWRLAIIGLGLSVGLVGRLVIANGVGSLASDALTLAAAATSALVGFGLLLLASQRDHFGSSLALLSALTACSLGVVQWISPHFSGATLEWDSRSQIALAGLGAANGLLVAGITTLALIRRRPTFSVVAALVTGVLVLAVDTIFLRNEWIAILVLSAAFGSMLIAWDRAPRHEPRYEASDASPRISRALLGLASVAFCGAAIQLWISRGDDVGTPLPAIGAAGAIIVVAFGSLIGIRREIQRRETTLSEWASWMREIRTRDLQHDFESLSLNDDGYEVGDVTAPSRPLSFPDLHVDRPDTAVAGAQTHLPPPAAPSAAATTAPQPPTSSPDRPALPETEPTRKPSAGRTGFDASDLDWFVPDERFAAPNLPTPRDGTSAPATPSHVTTPATAPLGPSTPPRENLPVAADSKSTAPTSAFSAALDAQSEMTAAESTTLSRWLAESANSTGRLVAAVETMSLASFDSLPGPIRGAAVDHNARALANLDPTPNFVAHIDGPYLFVVWDHAAAERYGAINKAILEVLAEPVAGLGPGDNVDVGLTGTLALLRPPPGATVETIIDDAIVGLVRARELAVVPRRR